MPQIFISYRRDDSLKDTGRIYDRMAQAFGKDNVFKDMKSIHFGSDFRGSIIEAISKSDIVFVIIGKQWLDIKDKDGNRRLDDPSDFVRIEVETALSRGERCAVIPILVDGAAMPTRAELPPNMGELHFKNAKRVRDDPDFDTDVEQLVQDIQRNPRFSPPPSTLPPPPPPKQGGLRDIPPGLAAIAAAIIGGIFLIVSVFLPQLRNEQVQTAQQTETAMSVTRSRAETGTAIALLSTNTVAPSATLTNTALPAATNTTIPTSGPTAIAATALPPTLPPIVAPTQTPVPSPLTIVVQNSTASPTVAPSATTNVPDVFPCSATVINPDSDATLITSIYDQLSDTSLSGETARVGSNITVQRRATKDEVQIFYLISEGSRRIGWVSDRYLAFSRSCFP